jgi:hypothetical protein
VEVLLETRRNPPARAAHLRRRLYLVLELQRLCLQRLMDLDQALEELVHHPDRF